MAASPDPAPWGLCAALAALLCLASCGKEQGTAADAPLPPPPAQQQLAASPAFSAQNAYTHCAALCALGPRPSGSAAYEAQLAYLEKHLQAAGWSTRREAFAPMPGMKMVNLHATYGEGAGSATATRPLLVSCHIDTKAGIPGLVGADDGASGAAVMLEAARHLAAQQPAQAAQVELLFFDGEESFAPRMSETDGMYGSRHDVARRTEQGLALPRWQVNLDMVGGRDMLIAPPLLETSEAMQEQYTQAAEALGLSPERWSLYPGSYLDDHLPYVRAGVDSLNLIAYFQGGGWWHTARDNMERISARSLDESGRMLLQLTSQLLASGQ